MKTKCLVIAILALLFLFPIREMLAQEGSITVEILANFDYPGDGNSTTPFGINRRGDISGRYLDTSGVTRGFVRFRNGELSQPIVEPNDTGNLTEGNDINNARLVVGDFLTVADGANHGYYLSHGVFFPFDVAGAMSTFVMGVNDAADFVGGFINVAEPEQAFVNDAGGTTTFAIPGATNTFAIRINGMKEVVGQYTDSAAVVHGFFRDAAGNLTFPIDFPAPGATVLYGINNRGWMVGRYTDTLAVDHGFFLKPPNTFVEFDYPGASGTSFNGINESGLIAARYADSAGLRHGFVARVTVPGSNTKSEIHVSRSVSSQPNDRPVSQSPPG